MENLFFVPGLVSPVKFCSRNPLLNNCFNAKSCTPVEGQQFDEFCESRHYHLFLAWCLQIFVGLV